MSASTGTHKGEVKFYKDGHATGSGYGFIFPKTDDGQFYTKDTNPGINVPEDQRLQIFFHFSGVANSEYTPSSKDEVEFEISQGPRGDMAINIELVKSAKQKNRSSLVATNMTIGVPKNDVIVLSEILQDVLKSVEGGATQLPAAELEALKRHTKTLKGCAQGQENFSAPTTSQPVAVDAVVANGTSNKSKKSEKKNSQASA